MISLEIRRSKPLNIEERGYILHNSKTMDKEKFISQCQHYTKVTKDFVVRQYHRLADFLAKKKRERRNNGSNVILGMRCVKYVVILMSIFYLLISLLMISFATSSYFILQSFYDQMWFNVHALTVIGIFFGVIITLTAIFGMVGAFRESFTWTKIYGYLLMTTFVLQILISTALFCLVTTGSSRYHVQNMIERLMNNYYDSSNSAQKMDWIQSAFQCCGGQNPSDWDDNMPYTLSYVSRSTLSTEEPIKYKTPESCCTSGSNYENKTCDNYYPDGCTTHVSDFVSEMFLIIGTVLLAIGVVQLLGMVTAFALSRMIKRTLLYRNVQKCSTPHRQVEDNPTFINYTRLNNSNDALDDERQI